MSLMSHNEKFVLGEDVAEKSPTLKHSCWYEVQQHLRSSALAELAHMGALSRETESLLRPQFGTNSKTRFKLIITVEFCRKGGTGGRIGRPCTVIRGISPLNNAIRPQYKSLFMTLLCSIFNPTIPQVGPLGISRLSPVRSRTTANRGPALDQGLRNCFPKYLQTNSGPGCLHQQKNARFHCVT